MIQKFCLYFFLILAVKGFNLAGQNITADPRQLNISILPGSYDLSYILEEISDQSGLNFTYDASIIQPGKRILIREENLSMEDRLRSVFTGGEIGFRIIDKNIVLFLNENELPGVKDLSHPDNPIKISGKIINKETKEKLGFATISLVGTNMGVLANEAGEFSFKIPSGKKKYSLSFSMIGFENYYLPLDKEEKENLIIEMRPRYISLQEVLIRYQDPNEIVKEAIKRIQENYHQKPSYLKAYFREFTLKDNEIMTFSEALLEIEKQATESNLKRDKVRIEKGRKIQNTTAEDTVLLKIKAGVHSSLQLDIITNLPDFLGPDFNKIYNFNFADIIYFNDRLVYLINFEQKKGLKDAYYKGQLYIEQKNLAIVAADFELNPAFFKKDASEFFIKKSRKIKTRLLKAHYRVEYSEVEGLHLINMSHADLSFKFRRKRNWISSTYKVAIELAVTDAELNADINIPRNSLINPQSIFSDQQLPADPEYWENYNIILPEEELREAVKRMGNDWKKFSEPMISTENPE